MNSDPVLTALLGDIARVRKWCADRSSSIAPTEAVKYIADNAEVLAFFISSVYDGANRETRQALQVANRALDLSVVGDANREIVESVITEAVELHAGNKLAEISDDDIIVLHRALQYASFLDSRPCLIDLTGSPIRLPS